jgi:hypothetical protein
LKYLSNYPKTILYDEFLYLSSTIFTYLDEIPNDFFNIAADLVSIISEDEVMLSHVEQVAVTFGPLIIKSQFAETQSRDIFMERCFPLCQNLFDYCNSHEESTSKDRAYALLVAGCLIQEGGESALMFLQQAIEGVLSIQDSDPLLYSASILVIAASFICSFDQTSSSLSPNFINHLSSTINKKNLPTYKEYKLGFILQLVLAKANRKESYRAAVEMLETLLNFKADDELDKEYEKLRSTQSKRENESIEEPSLVIPFNMPIYDFDEFKFFCEVTDQTGFFNSLPTGLKKLVKKHFKF